MDREQAIKELLSAIDELHTRYWECNDPGENPVSFEISEVSAFARVVKSFDKVDHQIKVKGSKNKVENLVFIPKAKKIKKGDK